MDTFRRTADPRSEDERVAAAIEMVQEFGGLLATAEALAGAGRRIDLQGIEGLCGRICALALDLAPDTGRRFRPSLVGLLGRAERLEALLARAHAEV